MKTIIGITAALLITVLSVAYLYFSNLNVTNRSNNQILSEIPSDASVVLQHQNDQSLYDIFEDYTIFDTIMLEAAEGRKSVNDHYPGLGLKSLRTNCTS